jgi:phosphoglycerol geranylgeranyltransferase
LNPSIGAVEKYLIKEINTKKTIHITLIDPEKSTPQEASSIVNNAKLAGTSAIMVGGSTFVSQKRLDAVIKAIKRTIKIPTILFPNNVTGISRYADAIWYMSLLNSTDPYFLVGAQVLGAPLIKKFKLEPISLGYIILGEGCTASIIGKAIPIPFNKPELAVAHALAAQYLGMRFVYLEAGSGAKKPVQREVISAVKKNVNIPIIVGGGITLKEQAVNAAAAGASIIVTGNVIETTDAKTKISEIIDNISSLKK